MYDGMPDVGCPGIRTSLRNFYSCVFRALNGTQDFSILT